MALDVGPGLRFGPLFRGPLDGSAADACRRTAPTHSPTQPELLENRMTGARLGDYFN